MMKNICSETPELSLAAVQVGGNEDLVREIFLRLPAKCLLKFKLVSKQWSAFISDSQFVRDYSSFRSSITSGVYFCNSFNKSEKIESVSLEDGPNQSSGVRVPSLLFLLDVVSPGGKIKLLQSCHGLLLCEITCESSSGVVVDYIVCNPTTRKHKLIPRPSLLATQFAHAISLAFDPSESLHYKIVFIKQIATSGEYFEVYKSETGCWRRTCCSMTHTPALAFRNAFYWNRTIHWIERYFSYDFNFKTEELDIVVFPSQPRSYCDCNCNCNIKWPIRYFGKSRGYWHMIYIGCLSAYQFNVLEMDNETFKWSVKYTVDIRPLLSTFPEIICVMGPDQSSDADNRYKVYAFSILSFIKGEKDKDSELVFLIPGKVVSYKFEHQTVELLRELPSQAVDSTTFCYINSHQFFDSLAPV